MMFVYNKRGTLNRVNLAIQYGGICGALETERRGRGGHRSGPSSPLTQRFGAKYLDRGDVSADKRLNPSSFPYRDARSR